MFQLELNEQKKSYKIMPTIIDRIYVENTALIEFLEEAKQVSFKIDAELNFKKGLLLSIASLFEVQITELLEDFIGRCSNKNPFVVSFFKNKALKRQYHTLFSWANNANDFFSLFGNDFKVKMKARVKEESKLEEAVKSFLELGRLRNQLVHNNFAEFNIDKTAEELYKAFGKANYFIEEIEKELEENIKTYTE